MLTIYIIHVECHDIVLSHHLQLDVACDFTYATNEILMYMLVVTLFNCKLKSQIEAFILMKMIDNCEGEMKNK